MTKQEKAKALVEEFLGKNYGETIDHWNIAAVIKERYGSREYGQIVNMAKKELRESGKEIRNVWKVGYQVVPPDEYLDESGKRIKRGMRQVDTGVKILECAPVKDMSADALNRYNVTMDRTRILQAAVHGARVEIKMLGSKRKNPILEAANR